MPIIAKTIDFLCENHLRDSREWFLQNKGDYERFVKEPLYEMIDALAPHMRAIDPLIVTEPRRALSRVNRDTRFSKDKSLYRDHLWMTFTRRRSDILTECAFYFEFTPSGFSYGCGFYHAGTDVMETMRRLILENNKVFLKANKAYEAQDVFSLRGDLYKKNRYLDAPPKLQDWLNRKNIYFSSHSEDFDLLFSNELVDVLARDFKLLAPVYDFFTLVLDRKNDKI